MTTTLHDIGYSTVSAGSGATAWQGAFREAKGGDVTLISTRVHRVAVWTFRWRVVLPLVVLLFAADAYLVFGLVLLLAAVGAAMLAMRPIPAAGTSAR